MWLRRPNNNILECKSYSHDLNFLWKNNNIYVMDNHLAAGWCWLNSLTHREHYNFFHVDRHEDLCGGCATQDELRQIKDKHPFDINQYCEFTFDHGISTPPYPYNKVFSWDTYIKQLQYMFPHWFTKCYFACPDIVTDNLNTTLSLNITYNPKNLEIYENIKYWICEQNPDKKWIFNLDLDYFFNDEGMKIYSDEYIKAFAQN